MPRATAQRKVRWNFILIPSILFVFLVGHDGYFTATTLVHAQAVPPLPAASDWTDYRLAVDASPFGQGWDVLFEGATPAALVKKQNTYYLYFIGADNYISRLDNIGPSHQAIGLATSPDGVNWTKYPDNPVIRFSSSGNPEEGAVSAGVYVDANGVFHLFYGANIAQTPTTSQVNADVRYATSQNGIDFVEHGIALSHSDPNVWGSGDELHATMARKQGNTWYVYYVPNGVSVAGKLGVAWGTDPLHLSNSSPVTFAGALIPGGPGSIIELDSTTLAYFSTRRGVTEVRTAAVANPASVSAPLQTYYQPGFGRVVYLDSAKRTWFMLYDQWSHMGLQLAPYGSLDATPPTAPSRLSIQYPDHQTAVISWRAATDGNTGIVQYDIYRDSIKIGSTKGLTFNDSGLAERIAYRYDVRAINYHGTVGPGAALTRSTPADRTPAELANLQAAQNPYQLRVTFTEPVSRPSAENPTLYALSPNLGVSSAVLGPDERTVVLTTTTAHVDGGFYTLTVSNVADQAQSPNYTFDSLGYTYSALPALSGYFPLESSPAETSGANLDAVLHGNPSWPAGIIGRALGLSGQQYVEIDNMPGLDSTFSGSYALTAWARPASVPPNTTSSNGAYAVFAGPNVRLEYVASQRFVAQLPTSSGTFTLNSPQVLAGTWYHLAMVVDAVQQQLYLYFNGTPVSGSPIHYTGALNSLPAPIIGVMDEYYSRYRIGVNDPLFDYEKNFFVGEIDELRLYSRALSAAEVAALYQWRPPSLPTPTPMPTITPAASATKTPTGSPVSPTATRTITPTPPPPTGVTNTPTATPTLKPTRTPTRTP
jgi:hypothetical protein